MALRQSDKELAYLTARALRAKDALDSCSQRLTTDQFGEGDEADFIANREVISVVIDKEDLRRNSGRSHIRESYQKELVAELNFQPGVAAELKDGKIYAKAVPMNDIQNSAMSLSTLIQEGNNARAILTEDDDD